MTDTHTQKGGYRFIITYGDGVIGVSKIFLSDGLRYASRA